MAAGASPRRDCALAEELAVHASATRPAESRTSLLMFVLPGSHKSPMQLWCRSDWLTREPSAPPSAISTTKYQTRKTP